MNDPISLLKQRSCFHSLSFYNIQLISSLGREGVKRTVRVFFVLLFTLVLAFSLTTYGIKRMFTIPAIKPDDIIHQPLTSDRPTVPLMGYHWTIDFTKRDKDLYRAYQIALIHPPDRRLIEAACLAARSLTRQEPRCRIEVVSARHLRISIETDGQRRVSWDYNLMAPPEETIRAILQAYEAFPHRVEKDTCPFSGENRSNLTSLFNPYIEQSMNPLLKCARKHPFDAAVNYYLSLGYFSLSMNNRWDPQSIRWEQTVLALKYYLLYRLLQPDNQPRYLDILAYETLSDLAHTRSLCRQLKRSEHDKVKALCDKVVHHRGYYRPLYQPAAYYWNIRRYIDFDRDKDIEKLLTITPQDLSYFGVWLHGLHELGPNLQGYSELHARVREFYLQKYAWFPYLLKIRTVFASNDLPILSDFAVSRVPIPHWATSSHYENWVLRSSWKAPFFETLHAQFHVLYYDYAAPDDALQYALKTSINFPHQCATRYAWLIASAPTRLKPWEDFVAHCPSPLSFFAVMRTLNPKQRAQFFSYIPRRLTTNPADLTMMARMLSLAGIPYLAMHLLRRSLRMDPTRRSTIRAYLRMAFSFHPLRDLISIHPHPDELAALIPYYLTGGFLHNDCHTALQYATRAFNAGTANDSTARSVAICLDKIPRTEQMRWIKILDGFFVNHRETLPELNELAHYAIVLTRLGMPKRALPLAEEAARTFSRPGLNALAFVKEHLGDIEIADALYQRAAQRYPERALGTLIVFYLRHGKLKKLRNQLIESRDYIEKNVVVLRNGFLPYCPRTPRETIQKWGLTLLETLFDLNFSDHVMAALGEDLYHCAGPDALGEWAAFVFKHRDLEKTRSWITPLVLYGLKRKYGIDTALEMFFSRVRSVKSRRLAMWILAEFGDFELFNRYLDAIMDDDTRYFDTMALFYVESCAFLSSPCRRPFSMLKQIRDPNYRAYALAVKSALFDNRPLPPDVGRPVEYAFARALVALHQGDRTAALDWLTLALLTGSYRDAEWNMAMTWMQWLMAGADIHDPDKYLWAIRYRWQHRELI